MQKKNCLYIIAGSPRCGKTTVATTMMKQKKIQMISCDAIREGLRNFLLGESYLTIRELSLTGRAEYKKVGSLNYTTKQIRLYEDEEYHTWQAVAGIINHYDRKNISLIVEGYAITLERIQALQLTNLQLRVVFVGFTGQQYLKSILSFSKKHKDWVYRLIQESRGNKAVINWYKKRLKENLLLKRKVTAAGFRFVSINNRSFRDGYKKVIQSLKSA